VEKIGIWWMRRCQRWSEVIRFLKGLDGKKARLLAGASGRGEGGRGAEGEVVLGGGRGSVSCDGGGGTEGGEKSSNNKRQEELSEGPTEP